MSQEHMSMRIRMALDMLQIITEDAEDNLTCDNASAARASLTISALYILTDYLRGIAEAPQP